MKILGIIPARGGSKGVPGKNIKFLGGKPLLAYTAERALDSKLLSRVVLTTDDQKIANLGKSLGLEVPFLRPPELALDSSPTLPVIQHVLDYYRLMGEEFEAICLLEVTSPFRKSDLIDSAVKEFIDSAADALVTVLPIPDTYNPHWAFESDHNGFLKIATGEEKIIPRRQELPKTYFRDGSIYLTKVPTIMRGSLYGERLAFLENDPVNYINIDTHQDWSDAETWLETNSVNK
jgi:CMP-N,N'-diacetyllegionaminic acid synthase